MSNIRLIVGLGNPGPQYEGTRHNIGFELLDTLAQKCGKRFSHESKFNGETCRVRIEDQDVWLLKPSTFMNLSGNAVAAMANYYKIEPEEIMVVHDELDLIPGLMKIKCGGGNAGHNGLKDITAKMGANFWRVRIGIGHPRTFGWAQQVADFVLSRPSSEHFEGMQKCINAAIDALPYAVSGDMKRVERLLAKYGSVPKPKKEKVQKPKVDPATNEQSTTEAQTSVLPE